MNGFNLTFIVQKCVRKVMTVFYFGSKAISLIMVKHPELQLIISFNKTLSMLKIGILLI